MIGDLDASRPMHTATNQAMAHAAARLRVAVEVVWVPTPELLEAPEKRLADFDGIFVAPGSPYDSLDGALRGIRYARESGRPLLGTCGGFQHVALEFARNVLGLEHLEHAEYEPEARHLLIQRLGCSISGQRAPVLLEPGSRAALSYGALEAIEEYRCSFGLAREHLPVLEGAGLVVSGRDPNGEPRVVELAGPSFYLATLFVPQLSSQPAAPHPLFEAFVAELGVDPGSVVLQGGES
ncbi:MAG: CTP synthase [Myxococcota bacterium]